jgi:hypothetical protein
VWVDIEGVKNGNITFVLDIKVDTPVITCRLFLIFFVGIVVIDKELEIAVDESRDPATAGSVEFHGFDLIFVVRDTDFDFFAGNGAIDFICKGLFECSRSEGFPEVGDECKGKGENLMRVEDELGFVLLHAS